MITRLLLHASALVAAISVSLLAGCGGPTKGCDFQNGSVNGPEPRCQERTGVDAEAFGQLCGQLEGDLVEGGCPAGSRVAGCVVSDTPLGTVTDWYYAPLTDTDVETRCESGTLVDP